jgi:hypothetical protein
MCHPTCFAWANLGPIAAVSRTQAGNQRGSTFVTATDPEAVGRKGDRIKASQVAANLDPVVTPRTAQVGDSQEAVDAANGDPMAIWRDSKAFDLSALVDRKPIERFAARDIPNHDRSILAAGRDPCSIRASRDALNRFFRIAKSRDRLACFGVDKPHNSRRVARRDAILDAKENDVSQRLVGKRPVNDISTWIVDPM